jgi:hypothetical protein
VSQVATVFAIVFAIYILGIFVATYIAGRFWPNDELDAGQGTVWAIVTWPISWIFIVPSVIHRHARASANRAKAKRVVNPTTYRGET